MPNRSQTHKTTIPQPYTHTGHVHTTGEPPHTGHVHTTGGRPNLGTQTEYPKRVSASPAVDYRRGDHLAAPEACRAALQVPGAGWLPSLMQWTLSLTWAGVTVCDVGRWPDLRTCVRVAGQGVDTSHAMG